VRRAGGNLLCLGALHLRICDEIESDPATTNALFHPSLAGRARGGTGRRADRVDGHHVGVEEARIRAR
jgi:hypothetical protein